MAAPSTLSLIVTNFEAGRGAEPGPEPVRQRFGGRGVDRPDPGRRADLVALLALGLLRQRPDRDCHRRARAEGRGGSAACCRQPRYRRRDRLHRWRHGAGLRVHPGRRARLDRSADPRLVRWPRRSCWRRSSPSSAGRGSRSCPSGSSPSATGRSGSSTSCWCRQRCSASSFS